MPREARDRQEKRREKKTNLNALHLHAQLPHHNADLIPSLKLLSRRLLQQLNSGGDLSLQVCERCLAIAAGRKWSPKNDEDEVKGDFTDILDLEDEWVHVRCETPV